MIGHTEIAAFYGNIQSRTSNDYDSSPTRVSTIGNRTDYVQIKSANGETAYMICDFTKWESLSQHSKRDHCT